MQNYTKDSPKSIQQLFNDIADSYDITNSAMSLKLHKYWNNQLINKVIEASPSAQSLLDLCAGTGEIAFGFLNRPLPLNSIHLLDFSEKMLACAQKKALSLTPSPALHFIQGDAQAIPLADNQFCAVTMAYGIRNVKDPSLCIEEVSRVLRPGGTFAILELTRPKNSIIRLGHSAYLKLVLPVLGKLFTKNRQAYEYLSSSINSFTDPAHLAMMLKIAGYVNINIRPLTFGVAHVISAQKPLEI